MAGFLNQEFREAANEYQWLLTRGYPQQSTLKLVGDKFKLSKDMRQILYRGISSSERAAGRMDKLGSLQKGDRVLIDGYNVLFTITNYLLGKPVFISNDGILRDAGEMRGRIPNKELFSKSVELFLESVTPWKEMQFVIYLDEPVSFSGLLSSRLGERLDQLGLNGMAKTVPAPDNTILEEESDAVCTSDTVIIDRYPGKICDLSRFILEQHFQPIFPSLVM